MSKIAQPLFVHDGQNHIMTILPDLREELLEEGPEIEQQDIGLNEVEVLVEEVLRH